MGRSKGPKKPTKAQFKAQVDNVSPTFTDADWEAEFGEVWNPIFPVDDLRGRGNLPNTPKVWYRSLHTISLLTALGALKPHPLRCTDNGALYVSSGGAESLTPYEGTASSGTPFTAFFAPRPSIGVEVSNDGSDAIQVYLTSKLNANADGGDFTGVGGCTMLTTEKFSWSIEAVAIKITCASSCPVRVQVLA